MDYSQPGSSVLGILQARILEWVAISFSRGWYWIFPTQGSNQGLLHFRQTHYCLTRQGNPFFLRINPATQIVGQRCRKNLDDVTKPQNQPILKFVFPEFRETGSPRSRWWRFEFLLKSSCLVSRWPPAFFLCTHLAFPVREPLVSPCMSKFLLLMKTSVRLD